MQGFQMDRSRLALPQPILSSCQSCCNPIAVNCRTEPQLYVLQNPAGVLRPEEELEIIQYLIRTDAWQRHAQFATI